MVGLVFDQHHYQELDAVRVAHLDSLVQNGHIPGDARLLDLGAGVGFISASLANRWPDMSFLALEGRQENVDVMRERYPAIPCRRCNVETADLAQFGLWDTVICYGLLYHLESPIRLLRQCSEIAPLLILETIVVNSPDPIGLVVKEQRGRDQGLTRFSWRLSDRAIRQILRDLFGSVQVIGRPDHPAYMMPGGNRRVYVARRKGDQ